MTLAEYDRYCRSLPQMTHVVQWGGAHVWKVADKVFVIGRWDDSGAELHVSFKASDMAFECLRDMPGLRPAPYLASRGLKWIQRFGPGTFDDRALRAAIADSHALVAAGLPKKTRASLGLDGGVHQAPAKARAKSKPNTAARRPGR